MSSSTSSGYMLFSAGGHRYAVTVDSVDEIAEMLPEYPIPGAPRFIRGAVNIHGKIAVLLDISMFLGRGPLLQGRNMLLLRVPGASLALLVEQMERIIYDADILKDENGVTGAYLQFDDSSALLINADALVDSLEKAIAL